MRPVGIAFLSLLISASALAQTPAPAAKQSAMKQKAPAASPQPAAYAAMALADRIAIQSDPIWTGDYNGMSDG